MDLLFVFCIAHYAGVQPADASPTIACRNSRHQMLILSKFVEIGEGVREDVQSGWTRLWPDGDPHCLTFNVATEVAAIARIYGPGKMELPSVVMALDHETALAVARHYPNLPMIFVSGPNPENLGLVKTLADPGGSATGYVLWPQSHDKKLEILRDLVPTIRKIGVIEDPDWPKFAERKAAFDRTILALGWTSVAVKLRTSARPEDVWEQLDRVLVDAWYIPESLLVREQEEHMLRWIRRARLPVLCGDVRLVAAGALVSVDIGRIDFQKTTPIMLAQILSGRKAGTIPVIVPSTTQMFLNSTTAAKLGIQARPALLRRFTRIYK
jgi:putative tryptophan/tyrosine transport system substrate-binding protein